MPSYEDRPYPHPVTTQDVLNPLSRVGAQDHTLNNNKLHNMFWTKTLVFKSSLQNNLC